MFLNCFCSSILLENGSVYFPFLSTDRLQWSSITMMPGSVFLDVAVIRHYRSILRDQGCETVLAFIFGLVSFVVYN